MSSSTFNFDFGTATSPVAAGYTQVTDATKFSTSLGYGWQSGTIVSKDKGTSDPLTRDFNQTTNGVFAVNLSNGTYSVFVTVGDPAPYALDDMGISLEGTQVDTVTTAAGQVVTKTYSVTVSNGQLDLRLKDLDGSDPNVCIEGLQIVQAS